MYQNYKITHNWFSNSEIERYLGNHLSKSTDNTILEIGSYEGLSACFLLNNFCNSEQSTLTCIDPFDINDKTTPLTNSTRDNFYHNTQLSNNYSKLTVHEVYSKDFFEKNTKQYNMIYIDGSHLEEDIIYDMTNADKILLPGGIMWMDDYGGGNPGQKIRETMDGFYNQNSNRYKIIHKGYQLALQKL